jgi:hypothetical protein
MTDQIFGSCAKPNSPNATFSSSLPMTTTDLSGL